ncbi:efflux RND transporter periplasmic adaptor subunit [Gillisia limnaea]|uniref:Efflux transporter, RND family, MFP subunit n=1 Tax=Gillisia limnaea (strain DSM 15749 / LMG 21470 / R-8282) TaxID=865937 RepID=H2BZ23_GILLR|nr:HlyD family efflux transporter periplasmic adaptor subunit [Gillisia limnaea]EHQ03368.1 efflux transporter, RND family, MFP subunit [Gillisia limnaea DSM 15749]
MRKIILSLLGLLLIIAAVFGARAIINSNTIERPPLQKIVKTVFVDTVLNREVPIIIPANGTVTALGKTELFSEVEGVFRSSSKEFRPGQTYQRGQVLLNIDASEFAANVRSARSELYNSITAIMPDLRLDYPELYPKWERYLNNFDVNKNLSALPETASNQEKYFISGRGIVSSYYNIKNLEARLNKFTIIAPYTGVLTEALVTRGSLIRPGQKLGEFIDPTEFELEVAITKSFSDLLKIGEKVKLANLEGSQAYEGEVSRINSRIDQESQSIQVFIKIEDERVKEGMYLEANLNAGIIEEAIEIPRELLVDQNRVYVVRDNVLQLVEIEPVYFSSEKVVIKGLENGVKLISAPVPGAFTGMPVEISQVPNPVKNRQN